MSTLYVIATPIVNLEDINAMVKAMLFLAEHPEVRSS